MRLGFSRNVADFRDFPDFAWKTGRDRAGLAADATPWAPVNVGLLDEFTSVGDRPVGRVVGRIPNGRRNGRRETWGRAPALSMPRWRHLPRFLPERLQMPNLGGSAMMPTERSIKSDWRGRRRAGAEGGAIVAPRSISAASWSEIQRRDTFLERVAVGRAEERFVFFARGMAWRVRNFRVRQMRR